MILTDEEVRAISKLKVSNPYLDIPFQYVKSGAKEQLKKVVNYGNDIGWVANEVGGALFCMKLEDWHQLKEVE